MSAAAIDALLSGDAALQAFGIDATRIFDSGSLEGTPRTGYFVVLRWEEQLIRIRDGAGGLSRGPQRMTLWLHASRDGTTDYTAMNPILDRIETLLTSAPRTAGADGRTLAAVRATGRSGNLPDAALNTIVRNIAFEVLSSPTPTP